MAKKVVKKKVKMKKPKKTVKKRVVKSTKKQVKKIKRIISKKPKKTLVKKVKKTPVKKSSKPPTKKVSKIPKKVTKKSIQAQKIVVIDTSTINKSGKNENKRSKELEALLLEERAKFVYELTRLEEMSLDKSQREASGDLSGYSIHMADVASDNEEIEKVLKLRSMFEDKIKWIDEALLKVKNGAFGICEECSEFIGIERLRARPEAKYCVKCKTKLEAIGQF